MESLIETLSSLAGEFSVQSFPTIKLVSFSGGKRKVTNFKGDRSAAGIIDWTLGQAKKISLARIGAKAGEQKLLLLIHMIS